LVVTDHRRPTDIKVRALPKPRRDEPQYSTLNRVGGSVEFNAGRNMYDYVNALRLEHLRGGEPVGKVLFDSKLQIITQALGTHTTVSRVQGNKLLAKREIRVASLFKEVPIEFLRMICVHELAHTKEREHDKDFYRLCTYMEFGFYYHSKTVDRRTVDMARGRSDFLSTDQTTPKNSNQLTLSYSPHTTYLSYPKQNGCAFLQPWPAFIKSRSANESTKT
jgi:hypothetical protein